MRATKTTQKIVKVVVVDGRNMAVAFYRKKCWTFFLLHLLFFSTTNNRLPKPSHSTRAVLGHLVCPWFPIIHSRLDLCVHGLLYVIRANILRVSMKFNQKGICAGRSEFLGVEHFGFLTDHEHIWTVPKYLRKIRSVPRVTSSSPLRPFN